MLKLYRLLGRWAEPFILKHLQKRVLLGKEDAKRLDERLGKPSLPRPVGKLLWIHAASVGESLSIIPLINEVLKNYPLWSVMVTTGTVTSAQQMAKKLPERAFHQYIPFDLAPYVQKFLTYWQPDLVLWLESEFWPNLLSLSAETGKPLILLNGRVSDRSFKRWQWVRPFISRLLGNFTACLGQTEEDARRLMILGAKEAFSLGNLKFGVKPLPCDFEALGYLRARLDGRHVLLAASTHNGEEEVIGKIHARLLGEFPGLVTIIVPRHPSRGSEIVTRLRHLGFSVAQRSAKEDISPGTDIYLADTMGELGMFYRLSPISFVGKSLLAPGGGQNPLEPAQLKSAIIFGPYMDNFREISQDLLANNAAIQFKDQEELFVNISRLLRSADLRNKLSTKAYAFVSEEMEVTTRVMNFLAPFMGKK